MLILLFSDKTAMNFNKKLLKNTKKHEEAEKSLK